MHIFTSSLSNYLIKKYHINKEEVSFIIEDEWDYIEDEYFFQKATMESLARELVDIYMVA